MVACETLTVAVPVFVTVRDCVVVLPTATSPKLRVGELAERTPVPDVTGEPGPVLAALVYPAQLDSPAIARNSATVVSSSAGCESFLYSVSWFGPEVEVNRS